MTPKTLMMLGASSGLFALTICIIGAVPTGGTVVVIFASGALFGKGYGILEERARRLDASKGER